MGGVTDFVFGGQPAPNTSPVGGTKQLPQYLSDASMQYVNKVNAVANDPYQTYDAPRLAGPTADQSASWQGIRGMQGKYQPALKGALDATSGTMGKVNPYFSSASSNLNAGTGTFTGDTVGKYMNPYVQNVLDRNMQLTNRNFTENIMPSLNSQFIGSGQYGSLGHEAGAFRGARDVEENLYGANNAALSGAYDTAQGAFGADQARRLQAGQAFGSLGTNYGNLNLGAADQAAQLAQTGQKMGYADVGALNASGQEQGAYNQAGLDQRYQDFLAQRDYQKNQLGWEGQALGLAPGMQSGSTTYTGQSQWPDNASPAATAGSVGSAIQGIENMAAKGGLIEKKGMRDIPAWLREAMLELMSRHAMSGA